MCTGKLCPVWRRETVAALQSVQVIAVVCKLDKFRVHVLALQIHDLAAVPARGGLGKGVIIIITWFGDCVVLQLRRVMWSFIIYMKVEIEFGDNGRRTRDMKDIGNKK